MKKTVARLAVVAALGFGIMGAVVANGGGGTTAWDGPKLSASAPLCTLIYTTAWGPDGGPHPCYQRAPLS